MNTPSFLASITLLLFQLTIIAQNGSLTSCGSIGNYNTKEWCDPMLKKLSTYPLIDSIDVPMIRSLSSYAPPDGKPVPSKAIIDQAGKVEGKSILFICAGNRDEIYVITESTYRISHLYLYSLKTGSVTPANHRKAVAIHLPRLAFFYSGNGIRFISTDPYSESSQVFYYDKAENILRHEKNCSIVNGKEKCDLIKD
jgi:hypothetical protein